MESEKFDQLESKIKGIVDACAQLKRQVAEQEELIRTKDRQLIEASESIRAFKEEKEAVRGKVESLLEKLEALDV